MYLFILYRREWFLIFKKIIIFLEIKKSDILYFYAFFKFKTQNQKMLNQNLQTSKIQKNL
jgi:hypothetical protein